MSVGSTLRAPETVLRDRRGHVIDLRPIAPRTAEELLTAYNKAGTGPTRRAEEVGLGTEKYRFWHPLPERYVFLAMRAYRKELISRARLAECLCTTENDTAVRLLRYVASVAELTQEDEAEPSRTS